MKQTIKLPYDLIAGTNRKRETSFSLQDGMQWIISFLKRLKNIDIELVMLESK